MKTLKQKTKKDTTNPKIENPNEFSKTMFNLQSRAIGNQISIDKLSLKNLELAKEIEELKDFFNFKFKTLIVLIVLSLVASALSLIFKA